MYNAAIALTPSQFVRRLSIVALPLALLIVPVQAAEEKATLLEFPCLIQPKMVLKLGSQVQGLIREVSVDRGAIVKEGEVLAQLESGVEEAELAIAKARASNDSAIK